MAQQSPSRSQRRFDLALNDLVESQSLRDVVARVSDHGARARIFTRDLAQVEELPSFVGSICDEFGQLDCLVNNAGVSVLSRGDILDVAPASFDRCIGVNLRAQFFLTQATARRMAAQADKGRRRSIITVTSVAVDEIIGSALAEYSISKAALSHMVKHFAVRLAPLGIECYELRPGMMKTSMTGSSRKKYDDLIASGFVAANRWGEVHEVAETAASLASGALRYTVGQVVNVDGGMWLKTF
ncbi:MAG: 3-ketoacyl-ACP reductase [Roseiarcus sp.]|uniref:3-ketoacyl-ACP reductase n=1 Tax=Roseiarcus sp. TaxID=1969460 RepID=UPI003C44C47F